MTTKGKKEIIGYNCPICKGKGFVESGDVVLHLCSGYAQPVFADRKLNKKPNETH